LGLARVHACRRLVEQEESRLGRERAGDLQPSLVAVRQVPGELVLLAAQADELQQLARTRMGPRLLRDHRRWPEHGSGDGGGEAAMLAHQRVLEHGHVLKEPDRLEGARGATGQDGGGARHGGVGSSASPAIGAGESRRPPRPWGRRTITRTSPRPKKNQRQSVRSAVASAETPRVRPRARTMKVVCVSTTRSKSVINIPPRITPLRLPAPPRTTMQRSMIDTWNSKAPGVMAWSLAA